jgi:hypothetical protein
MIIKIQQKFFDVLELIEVVKKSSREIIGYNKLIRAHGECLGSQRRRKR